MRVPDRLPGHEDEPEAEVGDAGGEVRLEEDVLALEVSVRDGRLDVERAHLRELLVQVRQARRHRVGDPAQLLVGHRVGLEKVAEGTCKTNCVQRISASQSQGFEDQFLDSSHC